MAVIPWDGDAAGGANTTAKEVPAMSRFICKTAGKRELPLGSTIRETEFRRVFSRQLSPSTVVSF